MTFSLSLFDAFALCVFLTSWFGFGLIVDSNLVSRLGLTQLMAQHRRDWMLVMAERDLRMIDTAVLTGLKQGSAFFGTTSILAIGGSFALFGSTDQVLAVLRDINVVDVATRALVELKAGGLVLIFVYAFFKFGWSYRLFNYCSILIGSVPNMAQQTQEARRKRALEAADMNIIASKHFNAGQRGIFFALAYLGWFVSAPILVLSTLFVLAVLVRRQFFSKARNILLEDHAD